MGETTFIILVLSLATVDRSCYDHVLVGHKNPRSALFSFFRLRVIVVMRVECHPLYYLFRPPGEEGYLTGGFELVLFQMVGDKDVPTVFDGPGVIGKDHPVRRVVEHGNGMNLVSDAEKKRILKEARAKQSKHQHAQKFGHRRKPEQGAHLSDNPVELTKRISELHKEHCPEEHRLAEARAASEQPRQGPATTDKPTNNTAKNASGTPGAGSEDASVYKYGGFFCCAAKKSEAGKTGATDHITNGDVTNGAATNGDATPKTKPVKTDATQHRLSNSTLRPSSTEETSSSLQDVPMENDGDFIGDILEALWPHVTSVISDKLDDLAPEYSKELARILAKSPAPEVNIR